MAWQHKALSVIRATLVDGTDLDLAISRHRVGAPLHPGNGIRRILDLPQPIAGDEWTRFRSIDHIAVSPSKPTRLRWEGHRIRQASLMPALTSSSSNVPISWGTADMRRMPAAIPCLRLREALGLFES